MDVTLDPKEEMKNELVFLYSRLLNYKNEEEIIKIIKQLASLGQLLSIADNSTYSHEHNIGLTPYQFVLKKYLEHIIKDSNEVDQIVQNSKNIKNFTNEEIKRQYIKKFIEFLKNKLNDIPKEYKENLKKFVKSIEDTTTIESLQTKVDNSEYLNKQIGDKTPRYYFNDLLLKFVKEQIKALSTSE